MFSFLKRKPFASSVSARQAEPQPLRHNGQVAASALLMKSPVWSIREDALTALTHKITADNGEWGLTTTTEPDCPPCLQMEGDTAILLVHGVLVADAPDWYFPYLRLQSTPELIEAIGMIDDNEAITNVFTHFLTPGGQVGYIAPCANALYALGKKKKTIAFCDEACSAGFWLASQCNRVYCAEDSIIGSLGAKQVWEDYSAMYAMLGIKVVPITSTGAEVYKVAGTEGTKITAEQQKDFKRVADEFMSLFRSAVQRGRGFNDETMSALADGRYHVGQNAVNLSLADKVTTREKVLSLLGAGDIDFDPGTIDSPVEVQTLLPVVLTPDKSQPSGENAPSSATSERTLPMTLQEFWDKFTASMKAEGVKVEDSVPATTTAMPIAAYPPVPPLPPVDPRLAELEAFKTKALTNARAEAKVAAVRAKGQGTESLARAERRIDRTTDLDDLADMTAELEEQAPKIAVRQSVPAGSPTAEEYTDKEREKVGIAACGGGKEGRIRYAKLKAEGVQF